MVAVVQSVPSRDVLIETIRKAGSGSFDVFGYELLPDGLYLQQDPPEFADFIRYMAEYAPPSDLTIDIGVASGGQTKFLRDFYPCKRTITVDMGDHPDAVHWDRIKKGINSDLILEIRDDSHSPQVARTLGQFKGKIDFAFVDGDHSYEGLRQDIILVRDLLHPGSLMALHDTLREPTCRRVYEDLRRSSVFEHVRDFDSKFGISLWRKRPHLASTIRRYYHGRDF